MKKSLTLLAMAFTACVLALICLVPSPAHAESLTVPDEGYAFSGGTIWGIKAEWLKGVCEKDGVDELDLALEIPASINGTPVTTIGFNAFNGTSYSEEKSEAGALNYHDHSDYPTFTVTSIDLEDATNLTTIESQAFMNCSEAAGVLVLPDSLTTIVGNFAFGNCTSLTGVVWPDNLTSLNGGRIENGKRSSSAFNGCSGLRFATTKDRYRAAQAAGTVDALNEIRFPDSLKVIGGHAFEDAFVAGAGASVWIPASVEYVGSEAFDNGSGTTPFSQIVVERTNAAQGTLGSEYDGLAAYDGRAFRWSGSASDRVVVFANQTSRDQFMENYSGLTSFKPSFTYELTLRFMNNTTQIAEQPKLFGLSVSYVRSDDGRWALDPNYTLPTLPDGADPARGDCWQLEGAQMTTDTLVTSDTALFYQSNDPTVVFEVKFTPRSGSAYTKTYQPGETVELDLGECTRADVSVKITHPEYDPDKDDPWKGQHVYIRCQWRDSVTGEGSLSTNSLFKKEWNYGSRSTSFSVSKTSHTRVDDQAYTLSVRGLQSDSGVENPSTDRELFNSDKYTLHVRVSEPAPVLDWLVVPTEDGRNILTDEYLDFLPEDADDALAHMSEKYDHAVAEDQEYNSLRPSPAISWSFDPSQQFDATLGAVNELRWSVDPEVFEQAGWKVPDDFPLSGTVEVHNPYAIDATAGEGGTIDPAGRTVAPAGSSHTFTVRASDGHLIDTLTVDGIEQDLADIEGATETELTYTFDKVDANHTIEVTFKPDESLVTPPEPDDPDNPTDPDPEPDNPDTPTDPEEPIDPDIPTDPGDPEDPGDSDDPSDSNESVNSGEQDPGSPAEKDDVLPGTGDVLLVLSPIAAGAGVACVSVSAALRRRR